MRLGLIGGEAPSSSRHLIMVLLAQTYTAKPMIEPVLKNAVGKAIVELGEETLLECAAGLAYGDTITKASDLSGRKALPKGVQFVISKLVPVLRAFSK